MSWSESQTEFRECAFDAIGFPLEPFDDYRNDVEKEMIEKSGYCLRPWIFEALKTVVVLIDVLNLLLDYVLTLKLHTVGEHGYAVLLGFMTTLSIFVSICMKYLMYGLRKETMQPEFVLGYVLITELFIFSFENVTTILILTSVDEEGNALVNLDETFGAHVNLWTTILSGVGIGLLVIVLIIIIFFEACRDGDHLVGVMGRSLPLVLAMFSVSYMLYFAVDKVLLENPMKEYDARNLRQAYVINMVVVLVVLICSNVCAYYLFAFGGGN